ncbi:MAG: phycobilisome degradation protein NblB [Microcystis sp.]|jgi:HEAT repeat protein|uniref:HEAT repeat domain-containing protein n=1 Tax=Microcystis aeruginosa G11-04 TaxID=2685956 RepID=A0A966FXL1_MICAE|nr:HEAT repeat domain-containing protein [Microcystis aeruginosa LE13-04]NCS56428.1 HEAT repeat domain-containing protein [Microcystis aeruginosa G11-04]NCT42456.1 HEAT repeat domain-containing protein [Microcystis aeruginosa G11-09]
MNYSPESVQRLLDSDDYGHRLSGVNQLRYLAPEIAFEMLQPLINDSNARVRYSAVSQLDILGRQNLDLALTILRDRLLHDPEADVKAAAADAIGGLKLTAAYDDLVAVYQQSCDWLIQFSIVAALGELGEPRGFELLEIALNSDNELVKTAAVSAFGELGDPRAVSLLVPLANDDDWQLRYRLAQALGRLGGQDAIAVLTQLTNDKSAQVAQEARNNLGQGDAE